MWSSTSPRRPRESCMELPQRLVNGTGYQTTNLGVGSSNLSGRASEIKYLSHFML
jgi:hypothetical protein